LSGEAAQQMRECEPAAVCLIQLAGADMSRLRSLVRRLRAELSGVPVFVARLGVPGTLSASARALFQEAGAAGVTRSLSETASALLPYAHDASRPASAASPSARARESDGHALTANVPLGKAIKSS
jgi:hypothetical protein